MDLSTVGPADRVLGYLFRRLGAVIVLALRRTYELRVQAQCITYIHVTVELQFVAYVQVPGTSRRGALSHMHANSKILTQIMTLDSNAGGGFVPVPDTGSYNRYR
jgi:hypothetical protein